MSFQSKLFPEPPVLLCRLHDGSIHRYTEAMETTNRPHRPDAVYLGEGVIYSVNGNVYPPGPKRFLHFWHTDADQAQSTTHPA